MVVDESDKARVIDALCKAHPYEEVAYDLYPIEGGRSRAGSGGSARFRDRWLSRLCRPRRGCLATRRCKAVEPGRRSARRCRRRLGRFVCERALRKGADVLITGDVDYQTLTRRATAGCS